MLVQPQLSWWTRIAQLGTRVPQERGEEEVPNGFKKQGPQDGKGKPSGKGPKGKGKGKHGKTNHALVAGGEPEAESSPLKDQSGDAPKKTRRQKKAEKAAAAAKAKAKPKAKA